MCPRIPQERRTSTTKVSRTRVKIGGATAPANGVMRRMGVSAGDRKAAARATGCIEASRPLDVANMRAPLHAICVEVQTRSANRRHSASRGPLNGTDDALLVCDLFALQTAAQSAWIDRCGAYERAAEDFLRVEQYR